MVATRFAAAVHILLLLATRTTEKTTSEVMARSVNTNPVVVRRITGQLARAGLVRVRRGPGGAELTRSPAEITLRDVWRAMKPAGEVPLLPLHEAAHHCPIGREMGQVLGAAFASAEFAMEQALSRTTLESLQMKISSTEAKLPELVG